MMDAIAVYSIMGIYLMGYFSCALDKRRKISSAWAVPAAILWPILFLGASIFNLWKWWHRWRNVAPPR
ncbi:TPA: hypothetical protein U5D73_000049 [Yersinia enterocolitica]|uniref:hypothetical protein n=1 Tax=Yersinia TaxID=629 RepID=UPI00119CFEE5|nr:MULTISPECIES: hypothetical protein [Yersinia]EKN4904638.1 hypothetical protein [Yersinia enterocolitica]EKN6245981.1 hypothetical protein [Yersinia enterocolitica]HEI6798618.1 hypothetical protein [Yersinia enterocolitica]HEI6940555.1 hypothetical protein [Yersinia enterocolitica]HEN3287592.1 hypothetical protein [Yersinia enterocolitica]